MCHRAKQTRHSFSLSDSRASKPFDLLHYDLWKRYRTPSSSGFHYFCVLDDFSRASWVYLPRDKKEACEHIVQFCLMV